MNFEELYAKYINGSASEEEKRYVEEEIAKARKLSEIIDSLDAKRVVDTADRETVKRARKKVSRRFLRTVIVTGISLILLTALLVSGAVFGIASYFASKGIEYSKSEAGDIAKRAVINYTDSRADEFVVVDIDKELRINAKLSKSVYVYEVSVVCDGIEYELDVDPRSGRAVITDIDD